MKSDEAVIEESMSRTVFSGANQQLMRAQIFNNLNNYQTVMTSDYKYRILIVDDQSFNLEALKIILKYCVKIDADIFCKCALSGQQALQLV